MTDTSSSVHQRHSLRRIDVPRMIVLAFGLLVPTTSQAEFFQTDWEPAQGQLAEFCEDGECFTDTPIASLRMQGDTEANIYEGVLDVSFVPLSGFGITFGQTVTTGGGLPTEFAFVISEDIVAMDIVFELVSEELAIVSGFVSYIEGTEPEARFLEIEFDEMAFNPVPEPGGGVLQLTAILTVAGIATKRRRI